MNKEDGGQAFPSASQYTRIAMARQTTAKECYAMADAMLAAREV